MSQQEMFFDSLFDALGADIAAAGGFKAVASKLWPAESLTASAARLRNSINTEQAQKLCPDEVLHIKRLAREAGSTATVSYEAQQLGFQVSWVDPKDEGDALRREFIEATNRLTKLAQRIEKADERVLKAVR